MSRGVRHFWYGLRTNYWFVPGVCLVASVALAWGLTALDHQAQVAWPGPLAWLQLHDPATARTVLATVASSLITVVSLVFSLTMVVLVLASSQFGSRLVQTFIGKRSNQWVLGVFVGTFLYCLLVLFLERPGPEGLFVPQFSTAAALVLGAASVIVLVFFFHEVAQSIQAESVIALVARDLEASIERLLPAADEPAPDAGRPEREGAPLPALRTVVSADGEGFLQGVDYAALVAAARGIDAALFVHRRPGSFVIRGGALAVVRSRESVPEETLAAVRRAFRYGPHRSPLQDIEFAIYQLVEVAVRALSPGVNDPFTAMACIDRLGAALARLAARRPAPGIYRDDDGTVRVEAEMLGFHDYVQTAFSQIRQHARGDVAVLGRMLETLDSLAPQLRNEAQRVAVRAQAEMVCRAARDAVPEGSDLDHLEARFRAVTEALEAHEERRPREGGAAKPG